MPQALNMTVEEIIRKHQIEMEDCKPVFECRIVALDIVDQKAGVPEEFGMTITHESAKTPTLVDVLKRLAQLALQYQSTKMKRAPGQSRGARDDFASFRHWCLRYGHDPNSPKARSAYLTIRRQAEKLRYVLGDEAYQQLLEAVK